MIRKEDPKYTFPSYARIASNIASQQRQQYLRYIQDISRKVKKLKEGMDCDAEHRDLIKKMIATHHNSVSLQDAENTPMNDLGVLKSKGRGHNAESLNEYLEDSDEDEDNFEAHLKFRKKALERELELNGKSETNKLRKKGEEAEE